ncbi:hypothetical protein JCM8097_007733 [Rhodosporidiobolus ruineniae]
MSALGSPAEGENPYTYYLNVLAASHTTPSDPTGFKIRLCVLLGLLGYYLLTSLSNLFMYLWSHKNKVRKLWLFRLVEKPGGSFIVGNLVAINCLSGTFTGTVFITQITLLYRYFMNGTGRMNQFIAAEVAAMPIAYAFGCALSFASFQAYLVTASGLSKSRRSTPVWVENAFFLIALVGPTATFIVLAILVSLASNRQWDAIGSLQEYLISAAGSWDGSALSAQVGQDLLARFSNVSSLTDEFFVALEHLLYAIAILAGGLLLLNVYMLLFVRSLHKHAKRTFAPSLPSLPALEHEGSKSAHPDPATFVPVMLNHHRSSSFDKPREHDLDLDRPPFATSPPANVRFFDTSLGRNPSRLDHPAVARPVLQRVKTKTATTEVNGRFAGLQRAKRELLLMAVTIGIAAGAITGWAISAIPAVRDYQTMNWSHYEALFTMLAWAFASALVHAVLAWRRFRDHKHSTDSSSSGDHTSGGPATGIALGSRSGTGGGGGGGFLGRKNALSEAVHVDVQVVTQHDVVELDEFERSIGLKRGGSDGSEKRGQGYEEDEDDSVKDWTVPHNEMRSPARR